MLCICFFLSEKLFVHVYLRVFRHYAHIICILDFPEYILLAELLDWMHLSSFMNSDIAGTISLQFFFVLYIFTFQ